MVKKKRKRKEESKKTDAKEIITHCVAVFLILNMVVFFWIDAFRSITVPSSEYNDGDNYNLCTQKEYLKISGLLALPFKSPLPF